MPAFYPFPVPGTPCKIRIRRIASAGNATALLLCGEPIDEPIVGSGPFVMNTAEEIRQAMMDYRSGKMGRLS